MDAFGLRIRKSKTPCIYESNIRKGKKIMKTRFSKLLSVLLCLSMLLTTFGFTVIAEGEAVTEYYVKFGGSGDGRSATAPAGSIATLSQTSTPTVMPQAIP